MRRSFLFISFLFNRSLTILSATLKKLGVRDTCPVVLSTVILLFSLFKYELNNLKCFSFSGIA